MSSRLNVLTATTKKSRFVLKSLFLSTLSSFSLSPRSLHRVFFSPRAAPATMAANTPQKGGSRLISMSLVLASILTFTHGQYSLSTSQQLRLQQQRPAFATRLTPAQQQQQQQLRLTGRNLGRFPAYRPAGVQNSFTYVPQQRALPTQVRMNVSPRFE